MTVAARESGRARIAVISDTHSKPHPKAADLVRAESADAILHAGDVGALSALEPFKSIAPLTVVRGNIDAREETLPDSVDVRVVDAEGTLLATLLLQHICVRGPKLLVPAARRAKEYGASIVVCGHSHVPFIGRDRDLYVFNPGSIGPRRFVLPIVFGVMDLTPGKLSLRHMSCETGERWTPDIQPIA